MPKTNGAGRRRRLDLQLSLQKRPKHGLPGCDTQTEPLGFGAEYGRDSISIFQEVLTQKYFKKVKGLNTMWVNGQSDKEWHEEAGLLRSWRQMW